MFSNAEEPSARDVEGELETLITTSPQSRIDTVKTAQKRYASIDRGHVGGQKVTAAADFFC